MSESLHARARKHRQAVEVRRFRHRQRDHALGTWDRFRRTLARAEHAYVVDPAELDALLAEGFAVEAVGQALQPNKRIVFVTAERAARLRTAESVELTLTGPLLVAVELVLVPFPSTAS